jgi:hypothetical protein
MRRDEAEIRAITQLIRIRRFIANEPQPRDPAALLIDGDDGRRLRDGAEIIAQLAKLRGRLDIASKQDEGAGLQAAEGGGGLGIENGTGHAGHQKLAELRHAVLCAGQRRESTRRRETNSAPPPLSTRKPATAFDKARLRGHGVQRQKLCHPEGALSDRRTP